MGYKPYNYGHAAGSWPATRAPEVSTSSGDPVTAIGDDMLGQ